MVEDGDDFAPVWLAAQDVAQVVAHSRPCRWGAQIPQAAGQPATATDKKAESTSKKKKKKGLRKLIPF